MKIVEMGGSGLSTDEVTGYLKFLAGRVAYFPCGTWDVGAFQAIEDDEAINPGKSWFDFDLAPWPISDRYANLSIEERQDKWFGRVDSIGYCVSKDSKNQKLAAELAYVLSADEEVYSASLQSAEDRYPILCQWLKVNISPMIPTSLSHV